MDQYIGFFSNILAPTLALLVAEIWRKTFQANFGNFWQKQTKPNIFMKMKNENVPRPQFWGTVGRGTNALQYKHDSGSIAIKLL